MQRIKGRRYEEHINKLINGQIIADVCDWADIEAEECCVEVKGGYLYNLAENRPHFARFQILLENHTALKGNSQIKGKLPWYYFVVDFDAVFIHKKLSWQQVDKMISGKKISTNCRGQKYCYLNFIQIFNKGGQKNE